MNLFIELSFLFFSTVVAACPLLVFVVIQQHSLYSVVTCCVAIHRRQFCERIHRHVISAATVGSAD